MVAGKPSEEVIALYDQLITLPYSSVKEINSIQLRLTAIRAQTPSDVSTAVALLQTHVMLGNAAEGIKLAEQIWRQGGQITPIVEATYMEHLIALGMYEWCLTLALPKLEARANIETVYPLVFNCAVGRGDLNLMEKVIGTTSLGNEGEVVKLFIKQQKEANLASHFFEQQKIINGLLRGKQTGYEVLVESERGWPELEIGVFVGGDSVDRYQLQVAIDKAQREYYELVGITPLDNTMTTIYDIKEHWPPRGIEHA